MTDKPKEVALELPPNGLEWVHKWGRPPKRLVFYDGGIAAIEEKRSVNGEPMWCICVVDQTIVIPRIILLWEREAERLERRRVLWFTAKLRCYSADWINRKVRVKYSTAANAVTHARAQHAGWKQRWKQRLLTLEGGRL